MLKSYPATVYRLCKSYPAAIYGLQIIPSCDLCSLSIIPSTNLYSLQIIPSYKRTPAGSFADTLFGTQPPSFDSESQMLETLARSRAAKGIPAAEVYLGA